MWAVERRVAAACRASGRRGLTVQATPRMGHVPRLIVRRDLLAARFLSRMLYYGFNLFAFYAMLLARSFYGDSHAPVSFGIHVTIGVVNTSLIIPAR